MKEAEPDWREIAWSVGHVNTVLSCPWVFLQRLAVGVVVRQCQLNEMSHQCAA